MTAPRVAVDWIVEWTFRHGVALSVEARAELLSALSERSNDFPSEFQSMPGDSRRVDSASAELFKDTRGPQQGGPIPVDYAAPQVLTEKVEDRDTEAEKERDRWKEECLQRRMHDGGSVWYWQGDGEDHPESLVCPVLMSAAKLRDLLAQREWVAVPDDASLGAHLTGIPGKPIYAIDERTEPFSRWRLDLPELPPAPK